jgi:hypothetical protein
LFCTGAVADNAPDVASVSRPDTALLVDDALDVVNSLIDAVLFSETSSAASCEIVHVEGEPSGVLDEFTSGLPAGSGVRLIGDLLPVDGEVGGVEGGENDCCEREVRRSRRRRNRRRLRLKRVVCILRRVVLFGGLF